MSKCVWAPCTITVLVSTYDESFHEGKCVKNRSRNCTPCRTERMSISWTSAFTSTYSLTPSLTYLTHSLALLLACSPTHTYTLTRSLTHSLARSLAHSLAHSLTYTSMLQQTCLEQLMHNWEKASNESNTHVVSLLLRTKNLCPLVGRTHASTDLNMWSCEKPFIHASYPSGQTFMNDHTCIYRKNASCNNNPIMNVASQ